MNYSNTTTPPIQRESILSMTLNQDGSCLAVGTTRGFRIYNVSPFRETFRRNLEAHIRQNDRSSNSNNNSNDNSNNDVRGGGIGIVEMLFRCNLLCLVGGGSNPQYPLNKVMIYDDHQSKCIGERSFRQQVVAVKLRRDRIAAATVSKVYLYNFADLSLLDQIHTISNPLGLLALSPGSTSGSSSTGPGNINSSALVLACPSIVRGHVRLEIYSTRKSLLVEAHETNLAAISLSMDGNYMATASVKGTVIRVFHVSTGEKLHELRRGTERATIACLSFRNPDNQWLATCSDKGTVHIFHLKQNNTLNSDGNNSRDSYMQQNPSSNSIDDASTSSKSHQSTTSSIQKLGSRVFKSVIKKNAYLSSEWSHAQVRGLTEPKLCTFLSDSKLAVVGADGSFWVVDYSKGGEAERLIYHSFFKEDDDELKVEVASRVQEQDDAVNEDGFVAIPDDS